MTLLRRLCLLALTLLAFHGASSFANANILSTPRTQTALMSEAAAIHAGDKFWVALHIQLQPGWHTYWVNPGDSGISPQLHWTLPNGFVAGPTQYLAPDRERVGPLVDYAYDNDAYYLVPIVPPSILRPGTTSILSLKASWLVCKDICVPESGDLSLSLPAADAAKHSDDAPLMAQLVSRLPVPLASAVTFSKKDKEIRFSVTLKDADLLATQIRSVVFFPESDALIFNAAEQKVVIGDDAVLLSVPQAEGKIAENASGVLSFFLNNGPRRDFALRLQSESAASQVAAVESATPTPASLPQGGGRITLGQAVWYAILGGLVLNAMPCVFPVLSLKALAVARKAHAHPADARRHGIAYTVGVIASFLCLAIMLVALKQGGQAVGWGYQMQSPVFVSLLALVLFLVGLNLAGYFEIPMLIGNLGGEAAGRDNTWGSLLTGVLAVVVATPCTAPFMAPSIGFALTQGTATIFAVFAGLGLGLASPFLLVSFFPVLIRALPKPGAWMASFKELLSFPMFVWTVWLVWVLARESGPQVACVTLLAMVVLAFAIWLNRRASRFAKILATISAAIAVAMAVFSAQMPVPHTGGDTKAAGNAFSSSTLASLRKQGRPVFVDATADWCVICKVNEAVALASPEVKQAFEAKHVTTLVADWTYGDADITHYLESFSRSGVPIYVYYPPGNGAPVVLPQVLTPSTVLEVLQ